MTPTGKGRVTRTALCLVIMVGLLNTIAELSFKSGAMAPGIGSVTLANLSAFIRGLSLSAGIWVGVSCYLVMFFLWIMVLAKVDLSVAFPLQSIDYLLVPLFSIALLHERVAFLRWFGTMLIMCGVVLVSQSATPKRHPGR